jgi:hypothetical protein
LEREYWVYSNCNPFHYWVSRFQKREEFEMAKWNEEVKILIAKGVPDKDALDLFYLGKLKDENQYLTSNEQTRLAWLEEKHKDILKQ